jgi:hypothetical protein
MEIIALVYIVLIMRLLLIGFRQWVLLRWISNKYINKEKPLDTELI